MDCKTLSAVTVGVIILVRGYMRLFKKDKGYRHKFISKAEKEGCFRSAKCIKTTIRGNSFDSSKSQFIRNKAYFVTYEYEVDGQRYHKTLEYQDIGSVSCRYPVEVTVYFDKKNPKKAYCRNEVDAGTRKNMGCLWSILSAVFVMWLILNIF